MKHLTPKSAQTLLENHSKLIDIQSKETLFKIVNFEIKDNGHSVLIFDEESTPVTDWQSIPATVIPNIKYLEYNNTHVASIYAFESLNGISSPEMQADSSHAMQEDSSEMQLDSKAPRVNMLCFPILSTIIIFSYIAL